MSDFSAYLPPGVDPCRWGHNTFLPCPWESCRCLFENDPQAWRQRWEESVRELDQPADWMTFLTEQCGLYIP
jgi:hypothetical protein